MLCTNERLSFLIDECKYTGMRLAGVEGVVVHEHDELKETLERTIADKEIGIILLTEKFGREFPEIVDDVKLHHITTMSKRSVS